MCAGCVNADVELVDQDDTKAEQVECLGREPTLDGGVRDRWSDASRTFTALLCFDPGSERQRSLPARRHAPASRLVHRAQELFRLLGGHTLRLECEIPLEMRLRSLARTRRIRCGLSFRHGNRA